MGACTSKEGGEAEAVVGGMTLASLKSFPGGGGTTTTGKGVDIMIGKIELQKREFDGLEAGIKANGGTPPPDSDLDVVATAGRAAAEKVEAGRIAAKKAKAVEEKGAAAAEAAVEAKAVEEKSAAEEGCGAVGSIFDIDDNMDANGKTVDGNGDGDGDGGVDGDDSNDASYHLAGASGHALYTLASATNGDGMFDVAGANDLSDLDDLDDFDGGGGEYHMASTTKTPIETKTNATGGSDDGNGENIASIALASVSPPPLLLQQLLLTTKASKLRTPPPQPPASQAGIDIHIMPAVGLSLEAANVAAMNADGENDNGQREVDIMIGKIEVQKREFDDLKADIAAHGGTPPPDSGLTIVAAEEGCDAVGSLFTIERLLEQQLQELVFRGGAGGATAFAADLETVRKDLAGTHVTLQNAVDCFLKEWKLNLPDLSTPPTDPTKFAELPIANKPGQVTMQQVIGALVLHAESKCDLASPKDGKGGADGRRRYGIWDHGFIDGNEAVARLGKAGFENGTFLVRQSKEKSEEFFLSVVFKNKVIHHPITTDSGTVVFKTNKKLFGNSPPSSLPELIEVLRKAPKGWPKSIALVRSLQSPESAIGSGVDPALLNQLLNAYATARTEISQPLIRAILADVAAYDAAAAKHVDRAGPEVMERLEAAATREASESMTFTSDKIASMIHDPTAPKPTALSYVVHAQRTAADVSIAVYNVICIMITAVGVGGYCIPGNVKQSRRIIFKTLFKYGGDLSKCRDLSRVTIMVPTFKVMADLVEALHKHPELFVIRCKNRFDPTANTSDAGGYRDFQTLCLFKFGGRHHYVEVQLNLIEMVAIKAGNGAGVGGEGGGGGGHDAFNTARVIDAFSKRSIEYRGNPTQKLWAMIASGSVLRVVLDGATMTEDDALQLGKAKASKQSRLNYLSTKKVKFDGATLGEALGALMLKSAQDTGDMDLSGWGGLTELPEWSSTLTNLTKLNLSDCDKLTALPEGLSKLTNLTKLDLRNCKELTALPEVSKLTNLTDLNLGGCWSLAELPKGLSKLTNLTKLDLKKCTKLTALPEGLSKLTNLTNLNFGDCWSLAALPEGLSKLTNLTNLNFGECRSLAALPEGLSKLTNLTKLNLSCCRELTALPEGLSKLTNLTKLNLSYCRELTALPEGLSKLTNLTDLNLSICMKLTALPEGLSKLTNLTKLNLRNCDKLTPLPEGLSKLTNLTHLNLGGCRSLAELPEGLSKLTNLTDLNLGGCRSLAALPEGLSKLTNLTKLDLSGCSSLTQPFPDLSQLLPALKVDLDYDIYNTSTSSVAKAWIKRGLISK